MFDLLSDEHGLCDDFRRILEVAALRHDAAKESCPEEHDVRGAEMVLADSAIPLRGWQRRAAAFLVRFHRDNNPNASEIAQFQLPRTRAPMVITLLAFLHAADGLDCRSVPTSAVIVRRKNRSLQVLCLVAAKLQKGRRALTRRRKFKLLRRTLGLDVDVRVELTTDALAAAA